MGTLQPIYTSEKRNYALRSFGPTTRDAVEKYVADQLGHHRMADPPMYMG